MKTDINFIHDLIIVIKKYFKNYKFISLKSGINKYLNYLDKNLY